jgi:DNA-binding NtrC family response regulator
MTHLLIDADPDLNQETVDYLQNQNITTVVAASFTEAEKLMCSESFDVITVDVGLEKGKIDSLLNVQRNCNPATPVIVTADFKHVHKAVQAIKQGAHNFIQKPYDVEDLHQRILKAIEFRELELEAQSLRGERELIYNPEDFISESKEMKQVLHMVKKVAPTDATVVLTGETGTGKELVSGAIHYNSLRSKKAFVKVNCAALPAQLLESELFGHEKGAFTGADKLRIGRFEQANGGSILLDEIADINIDLQVKLLRVLQEHKLERVGSSRSITLDVRVISATNKDLALQVEEGNFRSDLYYRLNVVNIWIPPLRDRTGDILPLARYFLAKFSGEFGKQVTDFDPEATRALLEYQWPGNVRELRNVIERAVLMAEGQVLTIEDLNHGESPVPDSGGREGNSGFIRIPQGGMSLEELEEEVIREVLRKANWVQKDAARLLKISPRSLNYKIAKYGIKNPRWSKNS